MADVPKYSRVSLCFTSCHDSSSCRPMAAHKWAGWEFLVLFGQTWCLVLYSDAVWVVVPLHSGIILLVTSFVSHLIWNKRSWLFIIMYVPKSLQRRHASLFLICVLPQNVGEMHIPMTLQQDKSNNLSKMYIFAALKTNESFSKIVITLVIWFLPDDECMNYTVFLS